MTGNRILNPLTYLPPRSRAYAYVFLGLLFLAVTAVQAADGDWEQALVLFLGSLGFATARTHIQVPPR